MKFTLRFSRFCIIGSAVFISVMANAQSGIINTIAGTSVAGYNGDGIQAVTAELYSSEGVALDLAGNIYIADGGNHRIRKIDASGVITTVAGTGIAGYSGDGGQATSAQLRAPDVVLVDASGNIYIDDEGNHCIRKVNTSGIITTVAGIGVSGFSGDGSAATSASFSNPSGIALDASGNLYIADANNNRIRKVNAITGIVTTIAGTGAASYTGDGGPATSAAINHPTGIAFDSAWNLYIAAWGNQAIRKINTSGIITTVAGTGTAGFSGDGGPATAAKFNNPFSITFDSTGNYYVADFTNNRIRKVSTSGIVTTIAGNGLTGFGGDGGQATLAKIYHPGQVALDSANNIYISDFYNSRVRKIDAICPSAPLVVNPVSVCIGSTAVLNSSAPAGIMNWYTTSTGGSPVGTGSSFTTPPITGSTSYYVRDSVYGCPDLRSQVNVNANPLPVVNLGPDAAFCAIATLNAGNPGSTYHWSDNATTQVHSVTSSGTYSVTVTNANGCTSSDTITVLINPLPAIDLGPDTTVCGSLILNAGNGESGYLWSDNSTGQTLNVTSSGSYSVTITDANGCSNSDAVTITVNPLPVITITSGPASSVCIDDAAYDLSATPVGGAFSGIGTGNGPNGPLFSPMLAGLGTQTITYTYTDNNGCTNTNAQTVTVNACTGIVSANSLPGITISPNPNNGSFSLAIDSADYLSFSMELVSIDGKIISAEDNSGLKGNYVKQFDISKEANGIYFIRIIADGQVTIAKIVKTGN